MDERSKRSRPRRAGSRAHALVAMAVAAAAVSARAGTVEIDLQVGESRYEARGAGECRFAPKASIYGLPAAMYMVSHRENRRSLSLTLWEPAGGQPAMVNLRIAGGASRDVVDTVVAGTKRDTQGSGTAEVRKAGAGGVFTLDAKTARGKPIRGRIKCGTFSGVQAEGG